MLFHSTINYIEHYRLSSLHKNNYPTKLAMMTLLKKYFCQWDQLTDKLKTLIFLWSLICVWCSTDFGLILGVNLIKLFWSKGGTHSFWKLYLFRTQKIMVTLWNRLAYKKSSVNFCQKSFMWSNPDGVIVFILILSLHQAGANVIKLFCL